MRIRKNGRVVNLTESDLRRITKRVISEQEEGAPKKCSNNTLKQVMNVMAEKNNAKIKIQTGSDYGISSNNFVDSDEMLIITHPFGQVCGCTKEEFFANV